MDSIDVLYFLWYNMTSIVIIFILLGNWYWQIMIRNEEKRIEEEYRIVAIEKQEECKRLALIKLERESNRHREAERELQKLINQIRDENMELRARTRQHLNEIEEERRRLRSQQRENIRTARREPQQELAKNNDKIFDSLNKIANIFVAIGTVFILGKAALK